MKRGELWTISGGPGFAGKPRPALIVQNDAYPETATVTICPITSAEMQHGCCVSTLSRMAATA